MLVISLSSVCYIYRQDSSLVILLEQICDLILVAIDMQHYWHLIRLASKLTPIKNLIKTEFRSVICAESP